MTERASLMTAMWMSRKIFFCIKSSRKTHHNPTPPHHKNPRSTTETKRNLLPRESPASRERWKSSTLLNADKKTLEDAFQNPLTTEEIIKNQKELAWISATLGEYEEEWLGLSEQLENLER